MKFWPGWVLAARSWISRPTAFEPVKAMKRVCGWATMALPNSGAGAGAEVDDAVGQAGLFEQADELGGDGGRVAGGLENDGVAADDGGGGHAGHDGEGEVPGRNDGADAQRNVAQLVAFSGELDGRGGCVQAQGLAGVELEEVDGLAYVGVGFGPVLADFEGQPGAELEACARG